MVPPEIVNATWFAEATAARESVIVVPVKVMATRWAVVRIEDWLSPTVNVS